MGSLPRDFDRDIKRMVQEIMRKDAKIDALECAIEDQLWPISRDGILRWPIKVSLILSGFESGRVFLSRDFYTPEGHKMAGELQVNGGSVSEGIYILLFARLKEGSDDANIQWPFPYSSVSFQVRRHDGGEPWEKIHQIDHLDQKFGRPTGSDNDKFGFVNFIALENLMCLENKFIEDDTVSIMISVNR